jgi:hypothetical protein
VDLLFARVSNVSMASSRGYIYVLAARASDTVVFYVGQTRQRAGALGRLAQHLSDSDSATFRQRVEMTLAADVTSEIFCAAFPLSLEAAFQREAPDYREAAEYLIEARLRAFVVHKGLPSLSVARVAVHPYAESPLVRREVGKALPRLESWLTERINSLTTDLEASAAESDR